MVIDSGASSSCLQNDKAKDMPIKPAVGTQAERVWTTADEAEVRMGGNKHVKFLTDEGEKRAMNMLASKGVSKSLGAVSEMCDNGSTVAFTKFGGAVFKDRGGAWPSR